MARIFQYDNFLFAQSCVVQLKLLFWGWGCVCILVQQVQNKSNGLHGVGDALTPVFGVATFLLTRNALPLVFGRKLNDLHNKKYICQNMSIHNSEYILYNCFFHWIMITWSCSTSLLTVSCVTAVLQLTVGIQTWPEHKLIGIWAESHPVSLDLTRCAAFC